MCVIFILHVRVFLHLCMLMYVIVRVCMYMYNVSVHTITRIYVWMYKCTNVMYVCMYVCMHIVYILYVNVIISEIQTWCLSCRYPKGE